ASEPGGGIGLYGYSRPNAFEITTVTPPQWPLALFEAQEFPPANFYSPEGIYEAGIFNSYTEALEISDYGAQIGHNPADIAGSFSSLLAANAVDSFDLEDLGVNLPDPTNDPGRIEITGANVDLTQTRLRAEGMVILNATNLIGASTATQDWGEA